MRMRVGVCVLKASRKTLTTMTACNVIVKNQIFIKKGFKLCLQKEAGNIKKKKWNINENCTLLDAAPLQYRDGKVIFFDLYTLKNAVKAL